MNLSLYPFTPSMYGAYKYHAQISSYQIFRLGQAYSARRLVSVEVNGTENSSLILNYSYINMSFCENFLQRSGINASANLLDELTTNISGLTRKELSCFSKVDIPPSPIPGFYDIKRLVFTWISTFGRASF